LANFRSQIIQKCTSSEIINGLGYLGGFEGSPLFAHHYILKELLAVGNGCLASGHYLAHGLFRFALALDFHPFDRFLKNALAVFDIISDILVDPYLLKVRLVAFLGLLLISLLLQSPNVVDPLSKGLDDAIELSLFSVLQAGDILDPKQILIDVHELTLYGFEPSVPLVHGR